MAAGKTPNATDGGEPIADSVGLVALFTKATLNAVAYGVTLACLLGLVDVRLHRAGYSELWLVPPCLGVFAIACIVLWRRWAADQPFPEDDPDGQPLLGSTRFDRLRLASCHLPERLPAGWTSRTSDRGSVSWRFQVGEVLVFTWARTSRHGTFVHVAMVHAASGAPVDTEAAVVILGHFRGVGEFVEADTPPASLKKRYPGVRSWVGCARDMVEALRKPRAVPEPSLPPRGRSEKMN